MPYWQHNVLAVKWAHYYGLVWAHFIILLSKCKLIFDSF